MVVVECGGGGMWNVVVVECGGGGGGEENKIKISTKCILFTIIFNTCLTTKLCNKFMYNYIHFIYKNTLKFMYNFSQFYLNNIPTYWHRDSLHSCHTALGFVHNPKMDACVQTQN